MQSITNGTDCGSLGDYLAWNASQWETTNAFVRYFEIDITDLCFYYGTKRLIKLGKRDQTDAINTCTKLGNGHLPKVESNEALDKFYEFARLEDALQTVEYKVKEERNERGPKWKTTKCKKHCLKLNQRSEFECGPA